VRLQEADCPAQMLIMLVFRQERRTPAKKTDLPTESSSLGRIVGYPETESSTIAAFHPMRRIHD
jgi:hypothetical protein